MVQRALDAYRPLVPRDEWSLERRYGLCGALGRVARAHLWRKEPEPAERLLREAIPLLEQIAVRSPGSTPSLLQERFIFHLLGDALAQQGRAEEAGHLGRRDRRGLGGFAHARWRDHRGRRADQQQPLQQPGHRADRRHRARWPPGGRRRA